MRTLGAATVVLALAAGCTGDPDPVPTMPVVVPTATPSPSPTPDPATVPPERPDLSRVDAATAEALAVYFLELFPYAAATGDLADWTLLSHPECKFCSGVSDEIESLVQAGHHSEGGLLHFEDVTTTEVTSDWWHVTARLIQDPSTTRDASGVLVESFPETKRLRIDVAVTLIDGGLAIREVDSTRED